MAGSVSLVPSSRALVTCKRIGWFTEEMMNRREENGMENHTSHLWKSVITNEWRRFYGCFSSSSVIFVFVFIYVSVWKPTQRETDRESAMAIVTRDYTAALEALSSLITKKTRGDGSNRGDAFHLMSHYVQVGK